MTASGRGISDLLIWKPRSGPQSTKIVSLPFTRSDVRVRCSPRVFILRHIVHSQECSGTLHALPVPKKMISINPTYVLCPSGEKGCEVQSCLNFSGRFKGFLEASHGSGGVTSRVLLATIDYEAVGKIIRRKSHSYTVTQEYFYSVSGHSARKFGSYTSTVVRFNLIHST